MSAVLAPSMDYHLPIAVQPIRESQARYKVLYGGRGSGKSWSVARILLEIGTKAELRILCTREFQNSIEESVHHLLKSQIVDMGLTGFYSVTDKSIKGINGTEFIFKGIRQQDITKVKSLERCDICWVEEAQVVTRTSWKTLGPTIRKTPSEIWVTFNPDLDTDETYMRFIVHPPKDSIVIKMNWRENPWFPKVLEEERQESLRGVEAGIVEQFDHDNIWEGICKPAVEGAIYANQIVKAEEDHRWGCNAPNDPLLKVHRVWDLGWGVMAVGMYQRQGSELRVVDYEEFNERTYSEVIAEIKGAEHRKQYRWGKDFLPHDSKAHNPLSQNTPKEVLAKLGCTVVEVAEIGVESGIKAAQQIFHRCYFDDKNTNLLRERLKRYRRRINQITDAKSTPVPDDAAHGADQFRYAAVIAEQMTNEDIDHGDPYKGLRNRYAG